MSNRIKINVDGKSIDTLADLLPKEGALDILFIAKTPAPISVNAGHYFQGRHGKMFWNMLAKYGILNVPSGKFEDDFLLGNNYGLTDIVKVPRGYGNEPSDDEYRQGLMRILNLIETYKPTVLVFVYKKVLDNITKMSFNLTSKSIYGFNHQLEEYFGSKVFVFPMPGTPCTRAESQEAMSELSVLLSSKQH